tara:strand:+ start:57 stop:809 length:753 start_codon:yes stop_codon:yes gene_type:complete
MKKIKSLKEQFYKNGFVKVENLFNKNEVKKLLKEVEKVKKNFLIIKNPNMHFTKDQKFNTIHNINEYIKKGFILKITKDKRLKDIVDSILESKTKLRNLEFFLKPAKTGKAAPVHQDNYYWNIPSKKALNVWIACTQSNSKNGGLYYFKSSHKEGLINHELSLQPGTSQQISSDYFKRKKFKKIYPDLKPGDCILHHCEVMHGSKENKSKLNRVGIVMSYKSIKAKIDKKGWFNYQQKLKKNNILISKIN